MATRVELATVAGLQPVAPALCLVHLEAPSLAPAAGPGQALLVRCTDPEHPSADPYLPRAYFVFAVDRQAGRLSLLVEVRGRGSAWLARRREGDRVLLHGPVGREVRPARQTRHLLLLASGAIGVAGTSLLAATAARGGLSVTLIAGPGAPDGAPPGGSLPPQLLPADVEYRTATPEQGGLLGALPDALGWADEVVVAASWPLLETLSLLRRARLEPFSLRASLPVQAIPLAPLSAGALKRTTLRAVGETPSPAGRAPAGSASSPPGAGYAWPAGRGPPSPWRPCASTPSTPSTPTPPRPATPAPNRPRRPLRAPPFTICSEMQNSEDAVRALREALRASPDNVPLRQHLADTLLGAGRAGEAEAEYRQALAQAPDDRRLKMGLAGAFYGQGKYAEALVLVELLIQGGEVPPRTYLLHARLLLRLGETERAGHQYRRALEFDPSLADEDLASRLGITRASPTAPPAGQPSGDDPFVVQGRMREAWAETLGGEGQTTTEVERPRLSFADVGGMESLKEEIRLKIIYPLTHPDLYRAYGKAAGGGILMYGPPGCGKTHLARATAGEIKAGFIAVGIDDVLDMWIGNSEKNLHALFDQARRAAPCVLFFDEVDALGASRTDMRRSGGRTQINQFLAEFDGVEHSNEGVLILAATNAPWHLDPAFRRPGRFDRILFVPPPDASARAAILRLLCQGKPQNDVDFEALAKTHGRLLRGRPQGRGRRGRRRQAAPGPPAPSPQPGAPRPACLDRSPQPLVTRDLQGALGTVRPSTKEWFATARNYALYANQGGAYDDVLAYLKLNKA